jgi:hypothetical protein
MGIMIGAAVLYLGLDMHFFRMLGDWKVTPGHPLWIGFSAVGAIIIFAAGKSLFFPKTFLLANEHGITIFSMATSKTWNKTTKSWDTTRRNGEPKLIPWSTIRNIQAGEIVTSTSRVKGTGQTVDLFGGKATIGAKHRTNKAKALQVLCDLSVKLEGYGASRTMVTWNGYTEDDLRQMSKQQRQSLPPQDLHSGFLLHRSLLKDSLPATIATLEKMRLQNLDATPHVGASYPS